MCKHELAEMDTEIADGSCPLCMAEEMIELRDKLAAYEASEYSNALKQSNACIAELKADVAYLQTKGSKVAHELVSADMNIQAIEANYEEAQSRNEYMKNLLNRIQWNGNSSGWIACPSCDELRKNGHRADCELMQFIEAK